MMNEYNINHGIKGGLLMSVIRFFITATWFLLMLVWPVLKWVISVDVFIQLILVFVNWDEKGFVAVVPFLIHFMVLTVLTFAVANWKPRSFK